MNKVFRAADHCSIVYVQFMNSREQAKEQVPRDQRGLCTQNVRYANVQQIMSSSWFVNTRKWLYVFFSHRPLFPFQGTV